jgi:DNA-binding response OmpR family regulator
MPDKQAAMTRKRLLVVDDVRDAAETLAHVLKSVGHEVEWLTDSRHVMDAARRFRPHLIFLDLAMPHINGYELAKMLRAEFGFESLRLVALTAHGDEENRIASRQAGFDAHVTKPADPEIIESILKTVFERGIR